MTAQHWMRLGLGVAIAVAIGVSVLAVILYKDWQYTGSKPYVRTNTTPARVIVVYYSRSGNTEVMAREIARHYDADLLQIRSDDYPQNWTGWRKAANDASDQNLPRKIVPETHDFSNYDWVFLGSPIWWYYPATPLSAFVEKNSFKNNKVILFNTFNSRFKPEAIEKFSRSIELRGGTFADHIYVKRGRIMSQLDTEELVSEVGKLLDQIDAKWRIRLQGAG